MFVPTIRSSGLKKEDKEIKDALNAPQCKEQLWSWGIIICVFVPYSNLSHTHDHFIHCWHKNYDDCSFNQNTVKQNTVQSL